jgi:molybdopterin synthase sulfur carrier subunit
MKIELKLYASLASHMPEKTGGDPWIVEARKGITIREFLEDLKVPTDAVKIMFLNGVHAKGNKTLNEGDRLGVFPSIAGG